MTDWLDEMGAWAFLRFPKKEKRNVARVFRRWRAKGLKSVRVCKSRRYKPEDLTAFLEQLHKEQNGKADQQQTEGCGR